MDGVSRMVAADVDGCIDETRLYWRNTKRNANIAHIDVVERAIC